MTQRTPLMLLKGSLGFVLKAYLIAFVLVGCTPRPAELSVTEARAMGTRTFTGSSEDVARAALVVLQDKHYSIELMDMNLGLITAKKKTEKAQAQISEEPVVATEEGLSEWETFCLVSGIMVGLAIFFSWLFGGIFDWDDDDDDIEIYPGIVHPVWGDGYETYGADYYEYTITLNMDDSQSGQTTIRLSIMGSRYENGLLQETGPVQSPEIYNSFFNALESGLVNNQP